MSTPPSTLEAEIARARTELAATVDELTTRLHPKTQAKNAADAARNAGKDTLAFVTGDGLPDREPARARNVKIVLGAAAAGVVLVVVTVLRRRSS
ncbi:DUF3618 domain-containing protein [Cellulomonas sp. PhB143]|uniref:DUF3618 domain-containing protein n=1 Tax=Cellulomonas sp. PhB143 TaxID=2485186 RepID=UPI000F4ADDD6|nr:DUF3618 domain-containing protein [Cellulomonas sp. PhB143]ROS76534.1 uncharacterized protein DUF3618 [Cellulomonas sp. PhB143]